MRKLQRPAAMLIRVLVLAGLVVLTWWLFLGSDTAYQRDVGGPSSGPYQTPQNLWCVVLLALVTVAGALLLPSWAVMVTVPVSFTAAWSIDASRTDRTGLWAVGAIGVLIGTGALAGPDA